MTRAEREICSEILDKHADSISGAALAAFSEWKLTGTTLSDKQRKWLYGVAERLGIATAPSENIFSSLSPERQVEQRRAAARVKLPWE
jgi:hypothetical protein